MIARKKYMYINSQHMVIGGHDGTPHGGQDWFPRASGGLVAGGSRRGWAGGGLRWRGGLERLYSNRV